MMVGIIIIELRWLNYIHYSMASASELGIMRTGDGAKLRSSGVVFMGIVIVG